MKTGIYEMDDKSYRNGTDGPAALSNSIAKILLDYSPYHAWCAHPRLNPNYVNEEKSEFDIGHAAHALLLEGVNRMQVIDADSFRSKAAQEERDASRVAGKYPILQSKYADIIEMAQVAREAISKCAGLGGLTLADGKPEQTLIWQERGVPMRGRLDWLSDNRINIWDYKTTTDASPSSFSRQIVRMGYHRQAAFYRRGVKAITGFNADFVLIAQETTAPYGVSFHAIAPSLMAIADAEIEGAITLWGQCLKHNHWPSYDNRIHHAEAPGWMVMEYEERQAEGIPYDPFKMWEINPRRAA